ANDKRAYDNVNFNFAKQVPDNGEKIKSIVCFSVSPKYRGNGIATALLEYVCRDAKTDGYALVEAYPFENNKYHAYHGPLSMYKKNGFDICNQIEGCAVCRKNL
ncbi:MAG: GNAT family N-acetyltransferase, partial [Clostridia bacterium]|nr:GNAT family N-acetyltransferase [Clostridia bacterium]